MPLVRLAYHSHYHAGPQSRLRLVDDIARTSAACNRRDDVTGVLIHDTQWFVQALEGPEAAVSRTFERILRDPRHDHVTLVNMQPVARRHLGPWWLAHAALTADNAPLLEHFTHSERFDPRVMSTERLLDLLDGILHDAAARLGENAWARRDAAAA